MKIYIQNPTQGPLITVSFDNASDASFAFVPAAMSSEPLTAATASMSGAVSGASLAGSLAIAAMLPGDTSSRPASFQGIRFFASNANVNRDNTMHAPTPAVGLPEDSTPSQTASTTATDVPTDWAKLSYADPREFLRRIQDLLKQLRTEMIRRLQAGESSEAIWQWLEDTLYRIQGDNPISRLFYDEGWWDDITIFRTYPGVDVSELTFEIRDTQYDLEFFESIPRAMLRGDIDRRDALNYLHFPPSRPLTQLRP